MSIHQQLYDKHAREITAQVDQIATSLQNDIATLVKKIEGGGLRMMFARTHGKMDKHAGTLDYRIKYNTEVFPEAQDIHRVIADTQSYMRIHEICARADIDAKIVCNHVGGGWDEEDKVVVTVNLNRPYAESPDANVHRRYTPGTPPVADRNQRPPR